MHTLESHTLESADLLSEERNVAGQETNAAMSQGRTVTMNEGNECHNLNFSKDSTNQDKKPKPK